ncbi:formate dehydrogenase accessory sulfurtransferase FdhD [Halobacillus yeomjeoni]|uniref:formate dehydrogenase accessory sulfurtransferase FdhD n=1 Tax=Halobacillus yeomjeoni TaxID=311194 RepID=UPI001CD4EAC6|nr:formate dehydrogenase accessory sulfurtransferase FdhD [Halobacillus yeomjeoni]MCA0983728.1 formate dehydrogenase accessory sulfurtransferase FdhD [Halobacillus yeomjeoni]
MKRGTRPWKMVRVEDKHFYEEEDEVAEEYPLTIVINGEEFATMVCTPMDLKELVVGFIASEGVIRKVHDLKGLTIDEDRGFAYVETKKDLKLKEVNTKRWIGSCCGKSRSFYFQNDASTARTVMDIYKISPDECMKVMAEFQNQSQMFKQTGGVHQAALADEGEIFVQFADIGRHNALDKLFGYLLLNNVENKKRIVIFSGRISSEVLLKVSKMRVGCLLSKSAPTNLALELARDLNITAVGFVRGNRMNIYTHPERIDLTEKGGADRERKGS